MLISYVIQYHIIVMITLVIVLSVKDTVIIFKINSTLPYPPPPIFLKVVAKIVTHEII